MRRVLLRSPAFARDLRKWVKARPDTADARWPGAWLAARVTTCVVFEYVQHEGAEAILLLALGTHDEVY